MAYQSPCVMRLAELFGMPTASRRVPGRRWSGTPLASLVAAVVLSVFVIDRDSLNALESSQAEPAGQPGSPKPAGADALQAGELAGQSVLETLVLNAHKLENQPAREALPLVEPLLSSRGTVSLQKETNTLIIRDHPSVWQRLGPVLADFDHPKRTIDLRIYLLRATRSSRPPEENAVGLPAELVDALGYFLQFTSYELLGGGPRESGEGREVDVPLGPRHGVRFQVGTVLMDRFLRLHGFEVFRRDGGLERRIFHSSLNLKEQKMQVVVVSQDKSSESGLVVAVSFDDNVGEVSSELGE